LEQGIGAAFSVNPRPTAKNHTVELPDFWGEVCFSAFLIPRLAL
jgi:hypothetical protein